jgi:[ribosomal protein S5]-alanine N-acetyltransferase
VALPEVITSRGSKTLCANAKRRKKKVDQFPGLPQDGTELKRFRVLNPVSGKSAILARNDNDCRLTAMQINFGDWQIRSYVEQDIARLPKYANNYKVWINLTNRFPHPYTEIAARGWITNVQGQTLETNFAIATADEVIGGIGFHIEDDVHCHTAMLGYWFGEPFWGRGRATLAARAITNYAFTQHTAINRMYASVFAWNPASGRVLEKAGYTCEGRFRNHVCKDGKVTDELVYGLLRAEWQAMANYSFF